MSVFSSSLPYTPIDLGITRILLLSWKRFSYFPLIFQQFSSTRMWDPWIVVGYSMISISMLWEHYWTSYNAIASQLIRMKLLWLDSSSNFLLMRIHSSMGFSPYSVGWYFMISKYSFLPNNCQIKNWVTNWNYLFSNGEWGNGIGLWIIKIDYGADSFCKFVITGSSIF